MLSLLLLGLSTRVLIGAPIPAPMHSCTLDPIALTHPHSHLPDRTSCANPVPPRVAFRDYAGAAQLLAKARGLGYNVNMEASAGGCMWQCQHALPKQRLHASPNAAGLAHCPMCLL